MRSAKSILSALAFLMVLATPVLAADTATTYTSGILVLLFVGFCALLVVAQLLPAIKSLFGVTKEAAKKSSESRYRGATSASKR